MNHKSPSTRSRSRLGPLALASLLGAIGCSGNSDDCRDTRTFFSEQVWGPVMGKYCLNCHGPGGRAQAENAKLRLLPSSYPGFLDANLVNIKEVAQLEAGGISTVLLKPLGQLQHGGGVVLQQGSAELATLTALVQRLKVASACAPAPSTPFTDVAMLDATATFRKAALNLVGRLPRPEELARIAAPAGGGDDALPALLSGLFEEDAFYDRIKEIYNDLLLTDRYMSYSGRAVGLLDEREYPGRGAAYWNTLTDTQKYYGNEAIAREPLELIAYVARKNKPFTEIINADYTVVNQYSAGIYGVQGLSFDSRYLNDFKEAKISFRRGMTSVPIPHAGLLTTPVFLNRFPTTETNRNRHRARMILNMFLATDILKVADRPIDPTAATRYVNPTREDPACATCHRILDPIAGAFQKYDDNDQDKLQPTREWHPEMYPAGFGGEVMQTGDIPTAMQWLAKRLVQDGRFVQATINTLFKGMTGLEPAEYPNDGAAADYVARLRAWEDQDKVFREIGEAFVRDNYNVKTLVRGLALSPYFRAATSKTILTAARAAELENFGPGRLLTPELLSRKLDALVGVSWVRGWDQEPLLLDEYRILYGGIDSDVVTRRLGTPNGVMAGVAQRMANEVACSVTAYDFVRPAADRLLFPGVTLLHEPESATRDPVPGAIATIKANIAHLHKHLLDEKVVDGDPELERTYKIFLETWREGKKAVAMATEDDDLPWQCQARENPKTGEDLPEAMRIGHDPNYTIRAWMAVVTYLLLDYRFLYE